MQVAGKKDSVRFGIRRPSSFSDGVAQDLSLEQVRKLSEELAQWVQDRE
jgi:hypothetical protein